MVDQATKNQDDKDIKVIENEDTSAIDVDDSSTDDDDQSEEDVAVVLDEEDSQSKKGTGNFGIRKRINKLNKKVDSARGQASQANEALEVEKQKNMLLQASLDQAREAVPPVKAPNADDFDDGIYDPKFKVAQDKYTDHRISERVKAELAQSNKTSVNTAHHQQSQADLEKKQQGHFKRAEELGVKDYGAKEDKVIDILGEDNVNHIISNFDRSEVIVYYLGANPSKAEEIAELVLSNPTKAVAEIGRLDAKLKVKSKTNPSSDPDEELEGGTPTSQGHAHAQHLRLLKKACSGKQADMTKLAKFRKEQKAKGIKL